MIIELPGVASYYQTGAVRDYKMAFFHFSNNNLSIRKTCAQEIGMYDPVAKKSEDVDICFRIAASRKWVALREKNNIVLHKARKTFGAFVRQIWGWGFHVGYPYSKTGIKGIYIYWVNSKDHKINYKIEIEKFPFLACMFISDFHAAHIMAALAFAFYSAGRFFLSVIFGVMALPFMWKYLYGERKAGLDFIKTCKLAFIHYIANIVFSTSAFFGALRHRVMLIPSSIFQPTKPGD